MARPRKPTELHLLEGTFRPDRHGEKPEATPATDPPTPMRKLSRRKQQVWDEKIATVPWLTQSDAMMAMMLVELYCEWEKAPLQFPTTRLQALNKLCNDLGLSSVARTRVKIPEGKKPKSPNDDFFDD